MINLSKIKGLRAELGLTQADVAKALGISVVSYNKKESGKRVWSFEEAEKFCSLCGIVKPSDKSEIFML